MDAADLKIFEVVARLGGMNRAATELNTVQSNVTARIRVLEEELGVPLFHRNSRGVVLTPAGQRLISYAIQIRHTLEDARRAVTDDGTAKGILTLGSLETTAALRLSPLLADYVAKHPEVELVLRTGTTCELITDVLDRRLEGAFVCGPVNHRDLVEEVVFREELVILTSPNVEDVDAVLRNGGVKIIVLRAGCSYRQRFEELLTKRGIVDVQRLEFATLEAIFGCVAAGLGLTLLPRSLVGTVWSKTRVAVPQLHDDSAMVDTMFVRRRDSYVSSALKSFLQHVRPLQLNRAVAE